MKLKRLKTKIEKNLYQGENGEIFFFFFVDREYKGSKKKPLYYLSKKEGEKVKYISGLFETQKQGVYSLDFKDEITGMKTLYFAEFKEGGEVLYIRAKKS